MGAVRVALVCAEPSLRLDLARAFDDAPPAWTVDFHDEPPEDAGVVVGTGPGPSIDVVFDPARPIDVIGAVESALQREGRAIIVTSACGGAGVTTIAIHLAAALSTTSAPACYIDLDRDLGGAARLGMPEDVRTYDPADGLIAVPHAGGFKALFAPAHSKAAVADGLGAFPICVVDVPAPGTDEVLLDPMNRVVVVVPPTAPGVTRTRALLERHESGAWVIAGNRVGPGGESTRTQLARALGRRFDVMLPCSAPLRDREDDGALLTTPLSRWKRHFDRLASGLAR